MFKQSSKYMSLRDQIVAIADLFGNDNSDGNWWKLYEF